MRQSYIKSLGHYVPENIVTNADLEKMMDTSDEWIQQRSGIKERRWVTPGQSTIQMAKDATLEALKKANLKPDDIDCIIFGAMISDYVFPGGGVLLQRELGITRTIPAYDIRNQCSAWPYSVQMADAFIRQGIYDRVLVVGSENHSTSLDKTTRGRDVTVLFGDAAAVAIFEVAPKDSKSYVIDTQVYSQGEHAEKLFMKNPSPLNSPRMWPGMDIDESYFASMDGKYVFKNAIERMCESLVAACKKHSISLNEIDFVVAHQANMRINQMVLQQLGIPWEKTHHTIEKYGNTTAATIPITLNEAVELGKVKRGDMLATVAFGSGFTWGVSLMRF